MQLTPADLAALPEPSIIEELSFEAILARRKDAFALVAAARGLDVGQYLMLESATETVLLEEAAYAEMALRNRINTVYRDSLLYFSSGAALDNVADESGVTRLPGELDADLKNRVRIKNRGSSSAGPDDWWRYWAMTASANVQDVAVTRPDFPIPAPTQQRGTITLSVLDQNPTGIPSDETLAAVRAVVNRTDIRGTTTEVIVQSATSRSFDVVATVYLLPGAASTVFDTLEASFRAAYASTRALGFDITPSWVIGQLQKPGVQRVELVSPASLITVAPSEAPLLNSVTLTFAGRAY